MFSMFVFNERKNAMKKVLNKITGLMIAFMVVGCSGSPSVSSAADAPSSSDQASSSSPASSRSTRRSSSSSSAAKSSSSVSSSSLLPHDHVWSNDWTYDATQHWHACSGCDEKKDATNHVLGNAEEMDLGTLLGDTKYQYTTVKVRQCATCSYFSVEQKDSVLPEFRVTFDANDPNANFATVAKSTDVQRPKLEATFNITNSTKKLTDQSGTIKVRGNQTAGFPKKGFTIKFDSKANLLGLNGGKSFKKWVLLADAKDTTISRTALGLSMSRGIIRSNSKVWASDYTPVSVYLNDQYWGMYWLAEQKEAKSGRIQLAEPSSNAGVDIGYCFELDHYAESEPKKDDGGDPTFSITYDGYENSGGYGNNPYDIESTLANPGIMKHFTMNSDITDGPAQPTEEEIAAGTKKGIPVNDTNSNQVKFIKDRLTALFKVLHQAAVNNKAYEINENNQAVASTKSVRQVIEQNFDLNAWAEGFIINGMACPPDLGYSSFYMSFDNTASGDKKLRFDCPWDFDSNFGNRRLLCEGGDSGQKDPYYLDRTSNMWIQMLSKLDFFINDYVKPLWNSIREEQLFEKCIKMLEVYYKVYDNERQKTFSRWKDLPNPDDSNVASYFSGELRDVFKQVSNRKNAEKETINWFAKRVNYFERKWGNNRPNIDTNQFI